VGDKFKTERILRIPGAIFEGKPHVLSPFVHAGLMGGTNGFLGAVTPPGSTDMPDRRGPSAASVATYPTGYGHVTDATQRGSEGR
jgi:hypothetical protein